MQDTVSGTRDAAPTSVQLIKGVLTALDNNKDALYIKAAEKITEILSNDITEGGKQKRIILRNLAVPANLLRLPEDKEYIDIDLFITGRWDSLDLNCEELQQLRLLKGLTPTHLGNMVAAQLLLRLMYWPRH